MTSKSTPRKSKARANVVAIAETTTTTETISQIIVGYMEDEMRLRSETPDLDGHDEAFYSFISKAASLYERGISTRLDIAIAALNFRTFALRLLIEDSTAEDWNVFEAATHSVSREQEKIIDTLIVKS